MSAAKDAEWLRWVMNQFGNIAGKDKEINLEEFKTALQVKESFFAERFFALFDADGSGTISLEELLKALSLLVHGNKMDKLRFLFQVYDVDGSGSIDPEELRLVLRWCLRESALALPEPRLADLTRALFEAADKDHSGSITFEELRQELEAFPGVMENLSIRLAQQDGRDVLTEYLLYPHPGAGGLGDTAAQTGLVLQGLLVAMVTFSCPCIRRSGHFQLFYWTHLSYISVWTLLILHGPHFWKWFAVPGCLFVLEKVTHLVIERPQFFHYKPGDFVYLNIPAIATYEWHPFTISSAPEQRETLWLHIRSLGQWTNKLYEYFQQPELPSPELKPLSKSLRKTRSWCWTQCYIDGPYGTPTRRIFTSEHAVLIGAGIGITPFASILQSIMYRLVLWQQLRLSPRLISKVVLGGTGAMVDLSSHTSPCEVDFIWINRDQKHFEWFVSLLTKLEMEQAEQELGGRFLEMHMYMTSALGKNDMKGVGLQLALDLLATKEQRDLITGLRTRTQPGRPDWSKVFGKVAEEKKGKVQVFFCGSPALAKVIRMHCEHFGFRFFKENF
ncbi:NADPH oxidase 5 [Patagioenas fasciata monilis]|uniref:NADPH oxidase 5 n=1 Tax=Patagioenas fasciata monilis TaxID=372326 RepID=A0A1V4JDH7_PATFA|nr:NADPH oxidase 5 [Patagioenas fasciata monilis]